MRSLDKDVIFTNVALTDDGDVWWEGMDRTGGVVPDHLIDWQGQRLDSGHRQGNRCQVGSTPTRFTVAATNNPALDSAWNDPAGVPIDVHLRWPPRHHRAAGDQPATGWKAYMAATMGSGTTAAAWRPGCGAPRPFAMLPFTGYNMATTSSTG